MPKASSSTPALRRNQACKQCRKRKLKCDAARPACGTCTRQWTAQVAVPPPVGFSHPTEPICTYDPVEGVHLAPETVEDPAARILLITKEIADLESKLRDAQDEQARSLLAPSTATSRSSRRSYSLSNPNSRPSSSRGKGKESAHMAMPDLSGIQPPSLIFQHNAFLESPRSRSSSLSDSPVPSHNHSTTDLGHLKSISDPGPLLGMLFSDWNPCLPEPAQLRRLVDDFFNNDPCGSRILHRPHFLSLLNLPSSHPDFPHPALLHAICASASRWSQHSASSDSSHSPPPFETSAVKREPTDTFHRTRNRFAEYHASKARGYIDQAVSSTSTLLPVLQASAILSWYFYREGRSIEVWLHAGFQTRIAVPLGLNHSSKSTAESTSPDHQRPSPYPDLPRSSRELEERRRVWWETVLFDRLVSVGGWLHSVDEKDIATEFPVCTADFESQVDLMPNPQSMFSDAALTHHIPAYTDSFILLVKACMLLGRVTDYNMRMNLRTGGEHPPILLSNPLSPYMAIPPPSTRPASHLSTNDEGAMPPGFRILDNLVAVEFLKSLPMGFKNCLGVGDVSSSADVDTDLYLVHLIPHAATITLHSPFTNFGAAKPCRSVTRCLEASRSILAAYYLLASTSFDVTRLHPFINICWYLAAIVQVRLCKRLIEIGDVANEVQVWGQINTLRHAMIRYGASSPIGLQQEKLLQSAMADIISMTSQNLPLTIGIPLYSFDSPYDSSPAFHTQPSPHTDLLTDPTTRSLPDINPDYTSEDVAHVSKWLDFGDNTALLTPPAKLW